jgi:hypothetical protein
MERLTNLFTALVARNRKYAPLIYNKKQRDADPLADAVKVQERQIKDTKKRVQYALAVHSSDRHVFFADTARVPMTVENFTLLIKVVTR